MRKRNKSYFGARKSRKCKQPNKRPHRQTVKTLRTVNTTTKTNANGLLDKLGFVKIGRIITDPKTGKPILIPFN